MGFRYRTGKGLKATGESLVVAGGGGGWMSVLLVLSTKKDVMPFSPRAWTSLCVTPLRMCGFLCCDLPERTAHNPAHQPSFFFSLFPRV